MAKIIRTVLGAILVAAIIITIRYSRGPDFENGFERTTLEISDAYDAVEAVVAALPTDATQSLTPKKGYMLWMLRGYVPSRYISRFSRYPIPTIKRGYIKNWTNDTIHAQINITKIVELADNEILVLGVIRYPKQLVDEFEYQLVRENDYWEVSKNTIINKNAKH